MIDSAVKKLLLTVADTRNIRNLKVIATPEKITLTGVAPSFYVKQMANQVILTFFKKNNFKMTLTNEILVDSQSKISW